MNFHIRLAARTFKLLFSTFKCVWIHVPHGPTERTFRIVFDRMAVRTSIDNCRKNEMRNVIDRSVPSRMFRMHSFFLVFVVPIYVIANRAFSSNRRMYLVRLTLRIRYWCLWWRHSMYCNTTAVCQFTAMCGCACKLSRE